MKETNFIEQNKEKWQSFEQLLNQPKPDSDELSNMFVQVTDDLSYARTFYPNRSVKVYLNNLSQKIFTHLYKGKKEILKPFFRFWTKELPLIMWNARRQLTFALCVFLIAALVGVISTVKDKSFPTQILGGDYMHMTEENIQKGEPMDVYSHGKSLDDFLSITLNNIGVAFQTFIYGIFFSLGTLFFLLYNGVMLGAFQWYFVQKGLFIQSFLSIWLHGTLEIASIIIAGGAGITLGSGLLFPGTYSRWYSFQLSARKALKIMAGTVPVFIIAGFIESFLTRYTHAPAPVKLLLIVASAAFLFIYFIWLPFRSGRAKKDLFHEDVKLNVAIADNQFTTDGIKTNGDILGQTFISFRKIWGKWFWGAVIISSLLLIWHIVDFNSRAGEWAVNRYRNVYAGSLSSALGNISETYFDFEKLSIGYFIQAALVAALLLFSGVLLEKLVSKTSFKFSQLIVHWLSIMVLVTVFFGILFLPWVIKIIVAPAVFGFLFIISFLIINEKLFLPNAIVEGWKIFFSNFGKIIGLNIVLFILSLALITLVISQSTTVYSAFIRWNVSGNVNTIKHFYGLLYNFIALFAYVLVVSFWFAGNSLLYFSLKEILHATTLKRSIASLKPKRKIYGKEFDV